MATTKSGWSRARIFTLALIATCVAIPTARATSDEDAAAPEADRRCLRCHGKPHIAELNPADRFSMVGTWLEPGTDGVVAPPKAELTGTEPDVRPGLYVTRESLAGSPHEKVLCVQCHVDAERLPHAPSLNRSTCGAQCHTEIAELFASSAHGTPPEVNGSLAPTCTTCHGGHEMRWLADRRSKIHRLNRAFWCAECHQKHAPNGQNGTNPKQHILTYLESTHGKAVSEAGLLTAANCVDCHGAHDVHPSDDPRSRTHRQRIPQTCGNCHLGVREIYDESIHGQRLRERDERAPVCTDCHTAHGITRSGQSEFMMDVVHECGECHNDPENENTLRGTYYASYRDSYHGQVTELGSTRAARCSDCHGAHDIRPIDDERSRVHAKNLIATCGQVGCHVGANESFVQFSPHANYRDRENYPLLYAIWIYFIVVMSGAFGFFGLHTLLWFGRSIQQRIAHGPHPPVDKSRVVRRFSKLNRVNHVFVALTFFGLTATGIPLVFSDQAWAGTLASLFGGIVLAGVWHRVFAFMLIVNFAVHLLALAASARRHPRGLVHWLFGPNSLVPKWKDVQDCFGMFRWFFGLGPKPRFGHWTYWEKFDYWAEIFGSLIIGGSGLLLWFPEIASRILPGWIFNAAMVVHGYEALLAIGFIFTIHFFNAHLRLDKFPVDDVIFTGRVPVDEFKEERAEEYAQLMAEGTFDTVRAEPLGDRWRPLWVWIGLLSMLFGGVLLVLIILGGLRVLS
ncbi:MAG: hypothetical protein KDC38_02610 [Planctomycetes bacterium]|nr:hypothetical protein [Planctomycetota bacterium]